MIEYGLFRQAVGVAAAAVLAVVTAAVAVVTAVVTEEATVVAVATADAPQCYHRYNNIS